MKWSGGLRPIGRDVRWAAAPVLGSHDPTQGMRQGNDVRNQCRSGIYLFDDEQEQAALQSSDLYQAAITPLGHSRITTEILPAPPVYYAEEYHQQYLAKNPGG